jgi:hypothetical protein
MQIHELTSKRKPQVNEIAGALAGMVGQSLRNTVNSQAGVSNSFATARTSGGGAQAAATQLNAPLVAALAKNLYKSWTTDILPKLLATSKTGSADPATIPQQQLIQALTNIVNQVLGFKYEQAEASIDPKAFDGRAKGLAKIQITKIADTIANGITKYPQAGSGQTKSKDELTKEFQGLATAMSILQNYMAFNAGGGNKGELPEITFGQDGKPLFDGKPYNPTDPKHQAALEKLSGVAK